MLIFFEVASAKETLLIKAFCSSKLLFDKSKTGKKDVFSNSLLLQLHFVKFSVNFCDSSSYKNK